MICSFISLAEENGTKYYDRWEFLNAYSGCMVGNPAISVIADAYRKGIRNYDVKKAYAYAVNTAEKMGNDKKLGYVPGRVSETLVVCPSRYSRNGRFNGWKNKNFG